METTFPSPQERVIFQPEFVEFGGEERVILSLCEALHAQGRPHAVMCYHDRINLAQYATTPLKVYQLQPGPSPLARVRSLGRAVQRLTAQGSPVPVLFNIQAAYHAGLAGANRYHLRIPDTYSLLPPAPKRAPWDLRRLSQVVQHWGTKRGIQGAQAFLTNTKALADEMQALYGRRADVVYLGGYGHIEAQAPTRSNDVVELLSVSRLQSSKRIDWVLRSLAALSKDGTMPAWHLHIVGKGPEKAALEAMAQTLGLEGRVTFHGFVTDAELDALYQRSHVFLMPARQGYGLPAIEALYRHCAVVMNVESGVAEVLGDTPWAVVSKPGEPAFRVAIEDVANRVHSGLLDIVPLPVLPSMQAWGEQVVRELSW